ncbi:hypothetical protein [Ideonella paludis]|uniref:hypothetical protein n=1 Tax=Ideonella paludis TaxID=1233411 RepID=UPI0036418C8A
MVKDWKELGAVREALRQARLQEEARRAQEAAEAARLARERQLFALSVGPVAPLKDTGRAELPRSVPTPSPGKPWPMKPPPCARHSPTRWMWSRCCSPTTA